MSTNVFNVTAEHNKATISLHGDMAVSFDTSMLANFNIKFFTTTNETFTISSSVFDFITWDGIPTSSFQFGGQSGLFIELAFDGETMYVVSNNITTYSRVVNPLPNNQVQYTTAAAIGGHRVVILTNDGTVAIASADDITSATRVIGITVNAADINTQVLIQTQEELDDPSWFWDMSHPVYLGLNGVLTQVPPTSPGSAFSMVVGFPITSTSLFINLREPIVLSN